MLNAAYWWKLYALGGAVMLLALGFYPVGEEAIFPIVTLEMWQRDAWFNQYLYGLDALHNPLLNWIIAPVAQLMGWTHVLAATRLVTIAATLGTGGVLAWLVKRLSGNPDWAALAGLCFLTFFDVLCYHGWLGYADPSFGFFIFNAVALLWIAARENRLGLLALSVLAISLGFLIKAQTAYIFYATAIFVLLFRRETRRFLLRPTSLLLLVTAFVLPLVWYMVLPHGTSQGGRMAGEILAKLSGNGLLNYVRKLTIYPLEILLGLFPTAWLAIWLLVRQRAQTTAAAPEWVRTGAWMALLMSLPYWIAPQGGVRYLIPVYPLFALLAAGVLWQAGDMWLQRTRRGIYGVLALQAIIFVAILPYYQSHYRGENYLVTASEVQQIAQTQPIYSDDTTAAGLNIVLFLDMMRYPQTAIQYPPKQWDHGFVLTRTADVMVGRVVKTYQLGGDQVFLLCRGTACPATNPNSTP